MKYGELVRDLRKTAQRTLEETAAALGVSRHVLASVERGANPPFARPYNARLLEFLKPGVDEARAIERAWQRERVSNMTPRAAGHGFARTKPQPRPAPTPTSRSAVHSSLDVHHTFVGTVEGVRRQALNVLRREPNARRARITVVLDNTAPGVE